MSQVGQVEAAAWTSTRLETLGTLSSGAEEDESGQHKPLGPGTGTRYLPVGRPLSPFLAVEAFPVEP